MTDKKDHRKYFFCGVGGSGMSALAYILSCTGYEVSGSDRSYDKGESADKFEALESTGIKLFPQDGSGLAKDTDILVVSSAIEDTIPDVRTAKELGVDIKLRAEVLAGLFNEQRGIGIAGTSGKTTVTGMVGFLLKEHGFDPTIMNGGVLVDALGSSGLGNAVVGDYGIFVAETDESDGSIDLFTPSIAVLNNIAEDHKSMDELRDHFRAYLDRAEEGAVVNLDDREAGRLKDVNPNTMTYGIDNAAADIHASYVKFEPCGVSFAVSDNISDKVTEVRLKVPGRHNVSNALAALTVGVMLGIPLDIGAEILSKFKGIRRRFDVIGEAGGVTVIDDFAHNPDKISATLSTLREFDGRLWVVFQPHGFKPMKMMRDGLVKVFIDKLDDDDTLIMPEIYYAGGTTVKDISSEDILNDVRQGGKQTAFFDKRSEIVPYLQENVANGDRVVVMGARDDTLTEFAGDILKAVS
jgi:UDP-N-acetylmuramate--alanine ligase